MKVRGPDPLPRKSGDYEFHVTVGYGDPTGDIYLDEGKSLQLDWLNADDCDRLVKAATEVRAQVLAYRAQMAAPHGSRYFHEGTCQLCGKPADVADVLHGEPRQEPGGRCAVAGCGHPKASHWEHNAASGGRVGCAILGCRCARYADPAEPERGEAPVIVPCPAAVVHGPCSRLAGHPVPHRTLAGHEWDDSPAAAVPAAPAAGGPPQGYLALAAPTLAASLAVPGKAAGDDGALEDAAAQDEDPADDPFMPAARDEDPDEADGFAAAERRAAEVTDSQERDGSRVAR